MRLLPLTYPKQVSIKRTERCMYLQIYFQCFMWVDVNPVELNWGSLCKESSQLLLCLDCNQSTTCTLLACDVVVIQRNVEMFLM